MAQKPPYNLANYLTRAGGMLKRPGELLHLGERITRALVDGTYGEKLAELRDDLLLMLDLVRAGAKGEYRGVESTSLLGIVAALLYLLAPVDAVPDFILGLGLVDDVAILTFMIHKMRGELDAFKAWRTAVETSTQHSAGE